MDAVDHLVKRNRIRGENRLTLEDLLNPIEEREIGESQYEFRGGNGDIVQAVLKEEEGDNDDNDDDAVDDEEEETEGKMSVHEMMRICEMMEQVCLLNAEAEGVSAVDLSTQLRRLRGHLRRQEMAAMKQPTLLELWATSKQAPAMDILE